jgi:hypothetical protein
MPLFSDLRARLATGPDRPGPGGDPDGGGTTVTADRAAEAPPAAPVATRPEDFVLTEAQRRFFDTFGFLVLPGLFTDEIGAITDEFERVFADQTPWESHEDLHFNQQRLIVPNIIDHSPSLLALLDDPRVVRTVAPLLGDDYIGGQSDGSLFSCETSWHADTFGAPMEQRHVKLSFYLDTLDVASGAIRVLPGTNHYLTPYARDLRRDLDDPARIESIFGVEPAAIPSYTISSRPGDVVAWDFRTIHASFNGSARRRLLSLNFKEQRPGSTEDR